MKSAEGVIGISHGSLAQTKAQTSKRVAALSA